MKKRVLAVLLAVCMIASTCVLFASAATVSLKKASYYVVSNGKNMDTFTTVGDLKEVPAPGVIKVTRKENPTLSISTKKIDESNVEYLFDFEPEFSKIKDVIEVDGTFNKNTGTATVTIKGRTLYNAQSDESNVETTAPAQGHFTNATTAYTIQGDTTVENITLTQKLFSLTMGLRFYGDNTYKNLNASEIADIKASYVPVGKTTAINVYVDKLSDIKETTPVTLTTNLKPGIDSDEYAFSCWVDGSDNVLSTSSTYTWIAGAEGYPSAVYAVYTELKSRVRINYSAGEHGKVAYQESTSENKVIKRDVLAGEGQISVMEGREVTFAFTPDEGYEVAHVYVTGKSGKRTDVASFLTLIRNNDFANALKVLIKATNREAYKYTFTKEQLEGLPELIREIEVVFAPIEFSPSELLTAPSGAVELSTIGAEGITLATGEDAANGGEGGNGGNGGNGGEGGNGGTTVPAENGAAGNGSSAIGGVVNPATGSTGAVAVFAALSVAAGAAVVTMKKKED